MIVATIFHESIGMSRPLPFVIDTGAERTLIPIDYERTLGINSDSLVEETIPINTLGGPVRLAYLPKCCIVLNDMNDAPYVVGPKDIYFFSSEEKQKKHPPLTGVPDFPCVLGRDVLDKLSLGYCQDSKYLFVTKKTELYRDTLLKEFPISAPNWIIK